MILIEDDHGIGLINPEIVYKRLKVRAIKLREIVDDEGSSQERRNWAYDEYVGYQQELQNLKDLFKMPFDVLIVIEKEKAPHNKRKQ